MKYRNSINRIMVVLLSVSVMLFAVFISRCEFSGFAKAEDQVVSSPAVSGDAPENTPVPEGTDQSFDTASPDASGEENESTEIPAETPLETPEGEQNPEVTKAPEETEPVQTRTPAPAVSAKPVEKSKWKIVSFQAEDNGAEKIHLRWSVVSDNQKTKGKKVFIYRAAKKNGAYERIRISTAGSYTDKKIRAGENYYYKLRITGQKTFSAIKKVKLLYKTPTVKLTKKRTGDGKKYLQFLVKSWRGNRIEISLKKGKGSYKKVKLKNNLLSKKKHLYKLLYTGKKQTFNIKIRTAGKRNGKNIYSNEKIFQVKI